MQKFFYTSLIVCSYAWIASQKKIEATFTLMNRWLHTKYIYKRCSNVPSVNDYCLFVIPYWIFILYFGFFFSSILYSAYSKSLSVMNGSICIALQIYTYFWISTLSTMHYVTMQLFSDSIHLELFFLVQTHWTDLDELKHRFFIFNRHHFIFVVVLFCGSLPGICGITSIEVIIQAHVFRALM